MALLRATRQLVGRAGCVTPLPHAFTQLTTLGAATPTQHLLFQAATLQSSLNISEGQATFSTAASPFNMTGDGTHLGRTASPSTWVDTTASARSINSSCKSFRAAGTSGVEPASTSSGAPIGGIGTSTGLGSPSGSSAEAATGLQPPTGGVSAGGATGLPDAAPDGAAAQSAEGPLTDSGPELEGQEGKEASDGGADTAKDLGDGNEGATASAELPKPEVPESEVVPTRESVDSLLTNLRLPFRMFQGHFAVLYVKNLVEKDFDEGEFLESAKDAFFTVQHLLMEQDIELLRPMVSPAIEAALEDTIKMMADEDVKFKVLEHNVVDALISDVQFLTDDEYSTLIDKSATAEDKKEARRSAIQKRRADGMNSQFASGKTMIVSVLFSASMKTERSLKSAGGEVSKIIDIDSRTNIWKFARGPLPERLPVGEAYGDWTIVGIA